MQKFLKCISIFSSFILIFTFVLIGYGDKIIPSEISIVENEKAYIPKVIGYDIYKADCNENLNVLSTNNTINFDSNIKLFNIFPVKNVDINVYKRKYVYLGGDVFGIKLFTNGVLVVGMDTIDTENGTKNPAKESDIKIGDVILSINGVPINTSKALSKIIQQNIGKQVTMEIMRNNDRKQVLYTPYIDKTSGKNKIGLWVRDSMAGIGTVTFYNPTNNTFGGLGHGIYDSDTEKIMPMKNGIMAGAYVKNYIKSYNGSVGELCGVLTGKKNGSLCINSEIGVYGFTDLFPEKNKIPVAVRQEVHSGNVKIYCTIDQNGPKLYDAKIIKILPFSKSQNKDMIIEITDKELLSKTGGILQGMSGTPIIQDGMLVGAITYVFVNNTKQGYAVLSEKMVDMSESKEMKKFEQLKNAS